MKILKFSIFGFRGRKFQIMIWGFELKHGLKLLPPGLKAKFTKTTLNLNTTFNHFGRPHF